MMLSTFVLLTGLAVQGARPATPPSSQALGQAYFLFIQGRTFEAKGDIAGAIAAYRQALQLTPAAPEVHAELASLFAREGRADEAVVEALAALKLESDNREAHRTLGLVQAALSGSASDPMRERALISEAVGHMEQVQLSGPLDPLAQLTLGRLYVRGLQYAKGISTLLAFLQSQPGYPEALMLLAEAYAGSNQPAQAQTVLEQAVAAQPDAVLARASLADLYERAGRWTDAAEAWGEVARRSPRNPAYRTRQAMALVNGGDLAAGRQKLADITTATPADVSAWSLLAQVERRLGNLAGAEDAARRIAGIDPTDPRGPLALAGVKAARKDFRGVVATLEPLVQSAREQDVEGGVYAEIVGELAAALQETGDRARAVRVFEEARRRDPEDPALLYGLASAYERANQVDRAEQLFRGVIAADPQNSGALNSLGYLLADHGQKLDEAVTLVTRALVIDPDNPSFLDSLGWAYVKQAKLDQARAPLERAAIGLAKSSVVLDHLAQLYFQLKRYRDAADVWDRALTGDRADIDVAAVTKKRDKARKLAGR